MVQLGLAGAPVSVTPFGRLRLKRGERLAIEALAGEGRG